MYYEILTIVMDIHNNLLLAHGEARPLYVIPHSNQQHSRS